jgi:HEAT repeat protein
MNLFAKTLITCAVAAGTTAAAGAAEESHFLVQRGGQNAGVIASSEWDPPQTPRDAGYQLYCDGYRLILAERWSEARKKFSELHQRYPHSSYLDDARFWTAYSWKYSDRKKALAEYARFMKEFPSSNYFDDAVAEYQRLGGRTETGEEETLQGIPEAASRIAELERQLAQIQERLAVRVPGPPRIPAVPTTGEPQIRIKIEALRSLTRSPEDEKAFAALKETALDTTQPLGIRMAALDGARRFRVPEVGGFLLTVVQNNRDPQFRMMALDGLRGSPAIDVHSLSPSIRSLALNQQEPVELRMSALQVLQQGDREQFPEVLAQIARSDRQKLLQINALRYLSQQRQVERQEAANVLREVALDRSRDPEVREVALFGLQQLTGPQASSILIETAKTDPQERVRLAAVYSLGSSATENTAPVNRALEELAADRTQPRLVRQTALARLGDQSRKIDVNFFSTLASSEPDEGIQEMAIHVLGKKAQGNAGSFSVLTGLFRSIPDERLQSKDVLLFSVASIGNDEAVDFLAAVARQNSSEALRERAVYYLGSIGTEKARSALLEILQNP